MQFQGEVESTGSSLHASRMREKKLADREMERLCLAWLDSEPEESRPVLLFSGGELREDSRYHILARHPSVTIQASVFREEGARGGRIRVCDGQGALLEEETCEDLLQVLRRWSERLLDPERSDRLEPFDQGWIGFLGYDLAWLFEYGLPKFLQASSDLPDLYLGWYESPLVMDRERGVLRGPESFVESLEGLAPSTEPHSLRVLGAEDRFHREDYEAAVERIIHHCRRGDIFQADLSRRIHLRVEGDARDLFKRLVAKSPAAFSAFITPEPGLAVASSSPEEYLRLEGSHMRTRPIKGTRPRGEPGPRDQALAEALQCSGKDIAELTMIVDLMRNDLGHVARAGTVEVSQFPELMTLPQVHHLFASVEAELDEDKDVFDLISASFPPGSISGAPKAKAIEILEMVERSRRGVYTGAIGYIEPGRRSHLNVAIRTAEWARGHLRFGVGGGITVGSEPSAEFEETEDKARGLAMALGIEKLP